jgi:hypothetical protein
MITSPHSDFQDIQIEHAFLPRNTSEVNQDQSVNSVKLDSPKHSEQEETKDTRPTPSGSSLDDSILD